MYENHLEVFLKKGREGGWQEGREGERERREKSSSLSKYLLEPGYQYVLKCPRASNLQLWLRTLVIN